MHSNVINIKEAKYTAQCTHAVSSKIKKNSSDIFKYYNMAIITGRGLGKKIICHRFCKRHGFNLQTCTAPKNIEILLSKFTDQNYTQKFIS